MSIHSLVSRIVDTPKFKEHYNNLLVYSVRSQIPNIVTPKNDFNIDWKYLISCSSIIVHSKEYKILDMVYRISQTVIQNELPQTYKNAAAMLLNHLSNLPAINLSKSKKYIQDDYIKDIPIGILLDVKQKQFSNTILDGDTKIVLNPLQKEVYYAFDKNQNISISAPTSTGKSFILLYLLKTYIHNNNLAKIIYIVPTRALIQQVELDIRHNFKNFSKPIEISSIPIIPNSYNDKACIFVFTQERAQWILDENPLLRFDLVIIDEAHKIGDRARGILLQQVLQKISRTNPTKFIFASPMSENPETLFNVVKPSLYQKKILSELVAVNQNLIWISQTGSKTTQWDINLLDQGKKILLGSLETERITSPSLRLPILAYRIAAGKRGNLLYVNGAADAEKVAIQLKSLIISEFPDFSPSQRINNLIDLIKKTIHRKYVLIDVLKAGVAFHYGNMPLAIRNEIEELFRHGEISFLVCTSTLIEGVNLPAKSIFIRGPKRGKKEIMNEMDFWNLAGRAGRQGKEFQGNIYCLDAGNTNVWKNGTPCERKKYHIESTIDKIVSTQQNELLHHLESSQQHDNMNGQELDYAYTYFLDIYFQHKTVSKSHIYNTYGEEFCARLDQIFNNLLQRIDIPLNILTKNQGVNPLTQQKLLEYFISSERNDEDFIPPHPEDTDAQEKYMHIIGRISKYLTNESYKLNAYRSILITNWMRGYGLARIISDNIRWHHENNSPKPIPTIIRDTLKEVEEYVRFKFLKYTTCYIDILKYYLERKGNVELSKKIPQINLWLEFGACKTTQITLMAMGFTRISALELAELMIDENYDKEKCIWWFSKNDINSLDLPICVLAEAKKLIPLYSSV